MTPEQIKVLEAAIELCGGYRAVRDYITEQQAEIAIIWSVEDVVAQANHRHIPITYDKAYNILKQIQRNHDSTVGINWDVIDCYLNHSED